MSNEQFQNEVRYQSSLSVAKAMLRKGVISESEFGKIDAFLLDKYRPTLGALFSHSR